MKERGKVYKIVWLREDVGREMRAKYLGEVLGEDIWSIEWDSYGELEGTEVVGSEEDEGEWYEVSCLREKTFE